MTGPQTNQLSENFSAAELGVEGKDIDQRIIASATFLCLTLLEPSARFVTSRYGKVTDCTGFFGGRLTRQFS